MEPVFCHDSHTTWGEEGPGRQGKYDYDPPLNAKSASTGRIGSRVKADDPISEQKDECTELAG
jgi:hypothetical protein